MHSISTNDFYEAGSRIRAVISKEPDNKVPKSVLQALVRDYLPQHEEMQEALRSIIVRPSFTQLLVQAKSGKALIHKSVFVESLRKIYSDETVNTADEFICGILALPNPGQNETKIDASGNREFYYQESNSGRNGHARSASESHEQRERVTAESHEENNDSGSCNHLDRKEVLSEADKGGRTILDTIRYGRSTKTEGKPQSTIGKEKFTFKKILNRIRYGRNQAGPRQN